jgi:hypothetical protein
VINEPEKSDPTIKSAANDPKSHLNIIVDHQASDEKLLSDYVSKKVLEQE